MRVTVLGLAVVALFLAGCETYRAGFADQVPPTPQSVPETLKWDPATQNYDGPLPGAIELSWGAMRKIVDPYRRYRDGTSCKYVAQINADLCLAPSWNDDFFKSDNIWLRCDKHPPDRYRGRWWYLCYQAREQWYQTRPHFHHYWYRGSVRYDLYLLQIR